MRTIRRLAAAAAFSALLAAPGRSPGFDETGACYTARVDEGFVLPDGSVHGPSVLRACVVREASPVQTLYSVFVDGRPVGAFLGRRECGAHGTVDTQPIFRFLRRRDGALVFTGYALASRGGLIVQTVTSSPAGTRIAGELVAVGARGTR